MATLTYTETLAITSCWCGAPLAVERNALRVVRAKGGKLWCPTTGHEMWFDNATQKQVTAAEERAARAEQIATQRLAEIDRARAEADHQAAVARGYKGALAKSKKRAAKGVCPVAGCKRHFADVERHIAAKHPDYVTDEA